MEPRFDLSGLTDSLAASFAKPLGLSRRGFSQLLHVSSFEDGILQFCGRRTDCSILAELCRCVLDRLCPEPEEGWLRFIYETLAAGLFPDPSRSPATPAQAQAMEFYLQVLTWLLDQEQELCPFDPLLDPHWATQEELAESRLAEEYAAFYRVIQRDRFPALLRIGRDCMPFDPASHTIGVNNVAVHGARLARLAGLHVDIPLVSAASLSHDIGKFGCRGKDAPRTPYLHYYFTWQYLSEQELPHIAHVAANHSTWDLEFENLPIESLLLIYADFRVRGMRDAQGKEHTKIYSLQESYSIILSKLANMTPEKQRRYATVYAKLRDFESFLASRGISPDMEQTVLQPVSPRDPALCSGPEAIEALRHTTFDNSLRLMDTFSTDASFEQLLEQAKSEKNLQRIRTYLRLFEEYNSYMPRHSKRMTLSFLYELLMHREGDVRRRAARIMGRILANSGPSYRKELPADAPATAYAPTLLGYFAEAERLWEDQILLCLHPDRKISAKHAQRIADSLKVIAESLFSVCSAYDAQVMARPLLRLLPEAEGADREPLISALARVPLAAMGGETIPTLLETLSRFLEDPCVSLRLTIFRCFQGFMDQDASLCDLVCPILRHLDPMDSFAVAYERAVLLNRYCGGREPIPQANTGELFLSNLKNAVHWTIKLVHIDYLRDQALANPSEAFHTAMHLSNLLSVSEHLPVREYAGHTLLGLVSCLTVDQRNEIVVDLTRELETGQEQISYYIPPYLGRLTCQMPDKELSEGVDYLDDLIHAGSLRSASAALHTLGAMMAEPQCRARGAVFDRVLGLLMTGIAHYDPVIHQTALSVLCRSIFGNPAIPLEIRRDCLVRTGKKLLCFLAEPTRNQLTFYNHAAMLNHLYRLIVSCELEGAALEFPPPRPVAFFPGTFDPFSAGHKEIVRTIHDMGFEVYLAIDEFSWSKRTLPRLLRRRIVSISVADQWDVYLYPDNSPVNLASAQDLKLLASRFPGRELYLAAGSDVVFGASAYQSESPDSARYYNHVIFRRAGDQAAEDRLSAILRGKWKLVSLPAWCDGVSSTQIREYVDKNLDISMLVNPIVQSYIYAHGLYLRSPQFKNVLAPGDFYFENSKVWTAPLPPLLQAAMDAHANSCAIFLRARSALEPLGWICGHTVTSAQLLETLGSRDAAAYVRQHTSGRIMMVDCVTSLSPLTPGVCRQLLGELLARSLETDHTYALCRCSGTDRLYRELLQLGFQSIPDQPDVLAVDMRSPMVLIQDALLGIKEPLRSDPAVKEAVEESRLKLRTALASLHPGRLLLTFDAETLNQSLWQKVQAHNQVLDVPKGVRRLGPYMCVPYGKILADEVVPNTVTKTLHADKVYDADMTRFTIRESPGYSSLDFQVRTIKSFRRPVILVDDLLHWGHRIHALDHIFKEEKVEIRSIVVGIMSGQGRDLMLTQGRNVDCEYFIPNLSHWLTESSLYPFLGGDSVDRPQESGWTRPGINMVLPYVNPTFISGAGGSDRLRLSTTALENARDILTALERQHLAIFSTPLTLGRLAEALIRPRLPDRGCHLRYDQAVPASVYLGEDLNLLKRISMTEVIHGL